MIQGGGNSGAEMQPPGLGMPMPPGSPTRLEAGQANGAEATSPTGNVNAGAPGQAGVGILGTTAGNLVGAGTLVAGPSMLPMTGGYGPERRQGGLMDPRNYGMYGQSSPRNVSLNGQSFQGVTGCTGCGFQQGACQGFSGCTGCGVQQGACQGFQQGCQGFQGCTGCGVQQGACLGTACSGQGCGQGMPCVSGQGQNLSQGLGQVGLERQGLTGCQGPNVGGVTPQNERMQEILRMTQGLDPMQVLRLRQALGEQVNQVRGVPELFGQRDGMFPNGYNPMHVGTNGDGTLDVFARSEKWIGNPPTPETAKWSNRELEILGWSTYIGDLVAWSMQASLEFGSEIEQACRWPTALQWQELSPAQRARSRRLMAILKAAFNGHPRTVTLINAYSEGVNLLSSDVGVNPDLQSSNGFELIRQLTMEYSLRTRSEALSFRTALAHKSFSLHASETSPSTVVTDTIRKIDYENARYGKLLGTLASSIDATGLQVAEADLVAVLLRSLPESVRTFCLHHTSGETYQSFRAAALRWEQQQRAFAEFQPKKQLYQLGNESEGAAEYYDMTTSDGNGDWNLDAVGNSGHRCTKCGSRKHGASMCDADLTKVRCFKCQKFGHISANCPDKSVKGKGDGKGVIKGKGKTKGKSKGKAKGKGFGKKGKMNELGYAEETDGMDEWYQDDGSWWSDQTWLQASQVWNETWSDWNEGWTADWTDGQWTEDWTWTGQESQQEYASSSQRPENSEIQSLVLSPLIGRIFGEISTGLVLQEAMDELGSSNSHSSWGDSVCVVSASGLSCPFNVGPPMCQCDNCEFQDWQLGRALDRHHQMLQKMTHLFESLPPFSEILPAQFFDDPELVFAETDACSVVFDQPGNLGDEIDFSSSDEDSDERHCLWDLNFGWFGCGAGTEDSGFLCGLLQQESSCTTPPNLHEPWFLGLQGEGSTGDAAEFSQGLVSDVNSRVVLNRTATSTFLNVHDTVSASHELRRYMPVLDPLLSEFWNDGQSEFWWLLDSGASATVMATSSVNAYGAWVADMKHEQFRAANGSKVDIDGTATITVWVGFRTGRDKDWVPDYKSAKLKCLVGGISHNIMSTTTLCECGWEFNQGPDGFHVKDVKTGRTVEGCIYYAGCPWIKLEPAWSSESQLTVSKGLEPPHPIPEIFAASSNSLNPLSRAAASDLERHRLQGHVPYDPRCTICARGKSTFHHRRRKEGSLETEVQADFAFLTTRGEVVDEESENTIKILVLTELATNCIGFVVTTATDARKVKGQVCKWLDHFGLSSSTSSVVLHTDAERAVSELVGTSSEKYTFMVRRARPQQHQSNGGAERAVRRLKESLAVLRAEMNDGGADVNFSARGLSDVCTYIALSHNHFSNAHGSDFSPLEYSTQRKLSKPSFAMFGSTVLAELPDSLRAQSPNETRSIEACFVHSGLDTGPVVQGALRIDGELVLKRFVARNVRPITPIAWKHMIGDQLFVEVEGADVQVAESQDVHMQAPPNAPPAAIAPTPARSVGDRPPLEPPRQPRDARDDIVEYPDGAPSELVREMKEPDNTRRPMPKKRPSETPVPKRSTGIKIAHQPPLPTPATAKAEPKTPAVVSKSPSVVPTSPATSPADSMPEVRVFPKTPRCPACDSGMVAPGIRHNADCKRRRAAFDAENSPNVAVGSPESVEVSRERLQVHFEDMEVDTEQDPAPAGGTTEGQVEMDVEETGGTKREAEQPVEELEAEMERERASGQPMTLDLLLMDDACQSVGPVLWSLEAGPERAVATSPELFDDELNSIKFMPERDHTCVKVKLGGTNVLVWKPDEVIDDSSLMQLNADLGFEGMKEEIANLEKCGAGKVIGQAEVDALKKKNPNMRVIPSRWVSAYKSETRVRVRIVAKDINKGVSARKLGISSPTPSIEGLHFVLSLASRRALRLKGLDVSHAFMHSPLPRGLVIVLKLPLSVSMMDGSPAYLLLYKALNGLRDASLHWLNLLSDSIRGVGLVSDEVEPCIYQGIVHGETALLVAYVDDLLLCCQTARSEKLVEKAIGKAVPLKETGVILPAEQGGGALTFIGRRIQRGATDDSLSIGVDPKFLDTTFVEFSVNKGSNTVPDVAAVLERALTDKSMQQPLTAAAYSRFRRALGKLLWMAQSRHDLKLFLSLIGSQQAAPTHGTEMAIKALLRFLHGDVGTCLRLPSPKYEELMIGAARHCILHSFSDASFAPYRFNGRKGITGGVVFCEGGLVRSIARQQQSVSLSSCEAELYALQAVSQESVAFSQFCQRVYVGLGEMQPKSVPKILLESDSSSALQLLVGQDIPKRSRHVEIRLAWMKSKMASGELEIEHRAGTENVADLFTKCLSTKDFLRHRASLGFEAVEVPARDLRSVNDLLLINDVVSNKQEIAFVEVCCGTNSALRDACRVARMPYVGVVKEVETDAMFARVKQFVEVQAQLGYRWIHVHASTPCSSGSPLKNFGTGSLSEADVAWEGIMKAVPKYLTLGNSRSFELPRNNNIWKRDETKHVLKHCGLEFESEVFLCQTGCKADNGLPVGKCLIFRSSFSGFCNVLTKRFGSCTCEKHAGVMDVNWVRTGSYTKELAKGILAAVRAARRAA